MAVQKLNIQQGYALFAKKEYHTQWHRHYGIELILCKEGNFTIQTEKHIHRHIHAAIIPSNMSHRFSCGDAVCKLLFLDPHSRIGKFVNDRYQLNVDKKIIVHPQNIQLLFGNNTSTVCDSLVKDKPPIKIDGRVRYCLREIEQNLTTSSLSVKQLSQVAYLSKSRLAHLFKEEMGVSIRQYILWNKVRMAVARSKEGQSLTSSAHYAGFTDSAHFSRTFLAMFGSTPSFALQS